jgi:S1-C subfamily serine protease
MIKKGLKILVFLILAMVGAAIFQLLLVPFLVSNPFFGKFEIIKNLKREIIVNPVEKYLIQENDGLKKAIEEVEDSVLKIASEKKNEGCGFSLTSDGLIIISTSLINETQNFLFINDKETQFQILDKDEKNDLVLIKVEGLNLKTASFADFEKIKPGEQVFLIGFKKSTLSGRIEKVVNKGIVKSLDGDLIQTNILEEKSLESCPLFNLEGQFVGLAKITQYPGPVNLNQVFIIPASKIRSFAGL